MSTSFIAGEQLELRHVGPEYWPLALAVRFRPINYDNNNVSYYIQVRSVFRLFSVNICQSSNHSFRHVCR